jgi:protein-S-isoprenylcysteine O-methyltransferase Ste14
MIFPFLIPVLWLAWMAYWLAASIDAKAVRRRESRASRIAHIAPLMLAVYLLAVPTRAPHPAWADWLFENFMPRSIAGFWAGFFVLATGLAFSVWARVRLGGNWSGTVTVKENHELIRTGPYRWVRHPIYTGILTGFVGTTIALAEWRGLIAVALCLYAFLRKMRLEERWMVEAFGERYAAYRIQVKGLIPFIL